jgi:hypothetical protein
MNCEVVYKMMPEESELLKKEAELAALEIELAQKELELATFNAELRSFRVRYLKVLGGLYSELDDLHAQIAEAQARFKPLDYQAQQQAAEARAQAEGSARDAESAREQPSIGNFKPTESLKKLYREVAKRVHPDLAADEKERLRNQQLMADANRAYAEGDEIRLRAILHQWESSPESVKGNSCGAKLVRMIRKIAKVTERIQAIITEINEMRNSSIYQLKCKVETAEAAGLDLLAEMAVYLEQSICRARCRLLNLGV